MYSELLYEVRDPVAIVTLNRPDRLNALTGRLLAEIKHAIAAAESDERVVGIVLTGAGRGFSAGADMQDLQNIATAGGTARAAATPLPESSPGDPSLGPDFQVTYGYLMAVRKPLLAAINGPCAGLGFVIAMMCDLRFASERATFTTAFANRGLIAEHGVSWILPRLIGPSRALDILWSGRKFDAAEADRLGHPQPAAAARRAAAGVGALHRGSRRQVVADLDHDHEAAGLQAPDGVARQVARGDQHADGGEPARARTSRKASPPTSRSGRRSSGGSPA